MLSAILIIFLFCFYNIYNTRTNKIINNEDIPQINNEMKEDSSSAGNVTTSDDKLKMLEQGKVDNLEVEIGTSAKKIIELKGIPDESGYYGANYFMAYDNVVLITNGTDANSGEVISIVVNTGEIYGVEIGMKFSDIIGILGKPSGEATYEYEEISEPTIFYTRGEFKVYFCAPEKDSTTNFAIIQRKNNN